MSALSSDEKKKQAIRLSNTFLAAGGGAILCLILFYTYHVGDLALNFTSLISVIIAFWLISGSIIASIYFGWNLRFKDPSLTVPQMYWASTTTLLGLFLSQHWDGVFYILVLLTMVFAVFRVEISLFKIYSVYVVFLSLLAVLGRHFVLGFEGSLEQSLIFWVTFAFSVGALSILCRSIMTLRNRLREKNQELTDALNARSYFLANMSHEIRTPMNGVLGMLGIALNKEMNQELRQTLEVARSSAMGLLTIINDILDFSKIDAGKLTIEKIPVNTAQFIDELESTFMAQAKEKSLEFNVVKGGNVPAWILADPVRLRQILNNLLGNAFKFTARGEVRLIVDAHVVGADVYLNCKVIDSGIGIDSKNLERIFEAFSQADESTTRSYGGTGLGLAICKNLAMVLGGKIKVSSTPGQGSVFELEMPCTAVEKKLIADGYSKTTEGSQREAGKKSSTALDGSNSRSRSDVNSGGKQPVVLLVEDNPTNQAVAKSLLADLGLDVIITEHGQDALEKLEDLKGTDEFPELVFMDCQMPVMDGYDATRSIRSNVNKNIAHLPIVAMTANTMVGDREKCLEAGMTEFLAKPIDVNALEKIVNNILFPSVSINSDPIASDAQNHRGNVPSVKSNSDIDEKEKALRSEDEKEINHLNGSGDAVPWDKQSILRLVRNKEERIPILLNPFLEALNEQQEEIIKCTQDEQLHGFKQAIHALKGSSANLGARALPNFLKDTELQIAEGQPIDYPHWLRQFDQHLKEMRASMEDYLGSFNSN